MIVTEEEAKTKRCQESFGPYYVTPGGGDIYSPATQSIALSHYAAAGAYAAITNGPQLPTVATPSNCIGSACMAWRWKLGADSAWTDQPIGYCGKAGKP